VGVGGGIAHDSSAHPPFRTFDGKYIRLQRLVSFSEDDAPAFASLDDFLDAPWSNDGSS
jgi:hypothetical protein